MPRRTTPRSRAKTPRVAGEPLWVPSRTASALLPAPRPERAALDGALLRASRLGHRIEVGRGLGPAIQPPVPASKLATPLRPMAVAPAHVQRMEFRRFQGFSRLFNWFYSDAETALLANEKRLREFLVDMQPSKAIEGGAGIQAIEDRFRQIERGTYAQEEYAGLSRELDTLFDRLDGISARMAAAQHRFLANYGAGNQDLMEVAQQRQQGVKAGALVRVILAFLDAVPAPVRTAKNLVLLKKAVHPDVEANAFREAQLGDHDLEFARVRSRMILDNLRMMTERIVGDWASLRRDFGLRGELKTIELTGSDFHNEGQQVAILESTGGEKAVYKPRAVTPDQGLVGTRDSAFSDLNQISEGLLTLGTQRLSQAGDRRGAYGYGEFVARTPEKSADQVRNYYTRYAQTIVASKLLGVNDLHSENVMATAGAPSIIDAETSYLPYVLTARRISATGIERALTTFASRQTLELENNAFLTPQERALWEQMTPQEKARRRLVTFENYVEERRKNDLNGEKNYLLSFERGLDTVLAVLGHKREAIAKMLDERFGAMTMTRVVPFSTSEFSQQIANFHILLRGGERDGPPHVVGGVAEAMVRALADKGFELARDAEEKIRKPLFHDFAARDTPILHFHPRSNELIYHGDVIGKHGDWRDPQRVIRDNLDWLAGLRRQDFLRDLDVGR